MDRKVLFGLAIAMMAIISGYFYYRHRTNVVYNAEDGLQIKILPYNGKYKNDPKFKKIYDGMPGRVSNAVARIKDQVTKPEPAMTVNIKFDDSFDNDPFFKPSLASECPPRPYAPGKGNCRSYTIRVGTEALVNDYRGRTSLDKMLTHELTHVWMLYHVPNHDELPDYIIEGVPIHIAGQERDILNAHSNGNKDRGNDYKYAPGEIHVTEYSRIIKDFNKKGYIPI